MKIVKFEIPIDGKVHKMNLPGMIVATEAYDEKTVVFWVEQDGLLDAQESNLTVAETGQEYSRGFWQGTTQRTHDGKVWHLIEVFGEEE